MSAWGAANDCGLAVTAMIRSSITSTKHSQRRRYSAREAAEAAVSVRIRIAAGRSASRCLRAEPAAGLCSRGHFLSRVRLRRIEPQSRMQSIGEAARLTRPPSAVDCGGSLSPGLRGSGQVGHAGGRGCKALVKSAADESSPVASARSTVWDERSGTKIRKVIPRISWYTLFAIEAAPEAGSRHLAE